ncbi:PMS1 protein homolog 1-like [Glandiceps talaboti]
MQMLPASTVRLITSSQVITSVVSVIKELTENSLDAKATNIDIKLENSGFDKIEVRDNGTGIKQSDTTYMAQRHYTSKIADHVDLEKLQTYGFRGEALASLCAVATVTIVTKTGDDTIGMMYTLDQHGKVTAVKPASVNQGTAVCVSHLFKHVPVRKQYYNNAKRRKEEMKKVEDLVMAFGVINPEVRFSLRHDKTTIIQKNKVTDYKAALMNVLGTTVMTHMESVTHENNDAQVTIKGFIPKSGSNAQLTSRLTNDRCFIFVNKRPVHLKEIEKVVKQYYSTSTNCDFSHPRYPVMFLSIEVSPDVVDVNLDPNKTTVLLHDKEAILETLSGMLDRVYAKTQPSGTHTLSAQIEKSSTTFEQEDKGILSGSQSEGLACSSDRDNGGKWDIIEIKAGGKENMMKGHLETESEGCVETNSVNFSILDNDLMNMLHDELQDFNNDVITEVKDRSEITTHGSLPGSSHEQITHAEISLTNLTETMTTKDDDSLKQKVFSDEKDSVQNSTNTEQRFISREHLVGTNERSCDISTNQDTEFIKSANRILDIGDDESSKNAIMQRICSDQKELCQGQERSNPDFGTTSWSKGHAIVDDDGKPVQPVQLLTGASLRNESDMKTTTPSLRNESDMKTTTPSLRSESDMKTTTPFGNSPQSSPGRKNKPLEFKEGQTTLYDMVGCTPVKRPVPAIHYFAKHIKPQVLQQNPGVDALTINRIIAEKWEEVETEERAKFEAIASKDTNRYQEKVHSAKRPRTPLNIASMQRSKRKKVELSPNQTLLETMMSPKHKATTNQNTESKVSIKVIDVPFDMELLRRNDRKCSSGSDLNNDSLSLIGRVKPHGIWLALRNQDIVVFNQYRVEESLLYHRLLSQHMLPRQPLDIPIVLNPSLVGGMISWQTLLSMQSTVRLPDPTRHYTDNRLLANGFDIQQTTDSESGDVSLKIVSMASCLPYYGLCDLKELLELVTKTTANTVAKCRPVKVIHYLQGEAVRMAHNLSTNLSRIDIEDMTCRMQEQLPTGCRECFHEKPFEIPIHSIGKT